MSDVAAEITTSEQSNTIFDEPMVSPVFFEIARLMPSPGVGRICGDRYSITPQATRGMLHRRYSSLTGYVCGTGRRIQAVHRDGAVAKVYIIWSALRQPDLINHVCERPDGADTEGRGRGEHHAYGHEVQTDEVDEKALGPQDEESAAEFVFHGQASLEKNVSRMSFAQAGASSRPSCGASVSTGSSVTAASRVASCVMKGFPVAMRWTSSFG